jgi:hypothetical protein
MQQNSEYDFFYVLLTLLAQLNRNMGDWLKTDPVHGWPAVL